MKTFSRICIKDYTLESQAGESCTVSRGKTYITSDIGVPEKGCVTVFTTYWIPVPVDHFAGEQVFTD